MANKIIYLRWGNRYTKDHVKRLEEQISKNCSVPYEFVTMNHCYAGPIYDQFSHFQKSYYRGKDDFEESTSFLKNGTPIFQDNFLREDLGGLAHWQKLLMFRFDRDYFDVDDKLLYIDLDSNIKGDLAYFFNLPLEAYQNKPMIAFDWDAYDNNKWQHAYTTRAYPLYNSSVLLWKPFFCKKIWMDIYITAWAAFYQFGMVDNWLFHRFGPWAYNDSNKDFFQPFDRDVISKDGIIETMSGTTIEEKIKCLA